MLKTTARGPKSAVQRLIRPQWYTAIFLRDTLYQGNKKIAVERHSPSGCSIPDMTASKPSKSDGCLFSDIQNDGDKSLSGREMDNSWALRRKYIVSGFWKRIWESVKLLFRIETTYNTTFLQAICSEEIPQRCSPSCILPNAEECGMS